MAAENYEACLKMILHHEGGYVNHPKDPGGETNLGVTKRVYEEWCMKEGYNVKDMKKNKLKVLFDQIAVKPGKPTTFGKIGASSYFLGLPGNPVSCFISLLFYFSQFVNCFYGVKFINLEEKKMKVSHLVKKNNSLTNFLRVRFLPNNTETFSVYENQDSSMQKILKESDGIWIRKPNEIGKSKNDACNIVVLNNSFVQEI